MSHYENDPYGPETPSIDFKETGDGTLHMLGDGSGEWIQCRNPVDTEAWA